jgi:prepilin-type N-terminal cleavage/methylation domain-containing protein
MVIPKINIKGFTLIELLVSVSIMAMMAALSISAYPKFSAQLSIVSESYRLVSFLRETQSYGQTSFGEIGKTTIYGIEVFKDVSRIDRVTVDNSNGALENSFGPRFTNSVFLQNKVSPVIEKDIFNFKSNYKIQKICSDIECTSGNDNFEIGYAAYKRPNPEARIFFTQGNLITPSPSIQDDTSSAKKMTVVIVDKRNEAISKKVVILSTGQIYVQE